MIDSSTKVRTIRALTTKFESSRIVIWYDNKRELRDLYEAIEIPDVTKREIKNNEFGLKYETLRQSPDQKFLLYKHGAKPEVLVDNWLLDIELAYDEFRTDQTAIILSELGLPLSLADIVTNHEMFFRSEKKRLPALKALMKNSLTANQVRQRMLAICADADGGLDSILEKLLEDWAENKDDRIRLIERCQLTEFLWKNVKSAYGYRSDDPSVPDFALTLFKSTYEAGVGRSSQLNEESVVLFRRWKRDKSHEGSFQTLSTKYADILTIEKEIGELDYRNISRLDYYEAFDRHILRNLIHDVTEQTIGLKETEATIRQRRESYWYGRYSNVYETVLFAARFLDSLAATFLNMKSMEDGIKNYSKTVFLVDQYYRKFTFHSKQVADASLTSALTEKIENKYANDFLFKLNENWQSQVDQLTDWTAPGVPIQSEFFKNFVAPARRKNIKTCVVISDAMRFEIGEELHRRIRALDRYDAELSPMLSLLPSYTQLGMAALLPHKGLEIGLNKGATVRSNETETSGARNRAKVLAEGCPDERTTVYKFEDFLNLRGDEAKSVFRDHDIIYIYHDRIDATGDSMKTEPNVFEAVEETFRDMENIVKKLTSANARRIVITADHGFLYQNKKIAESDYSTAKPSSGEISCWNRRFVIGQNLEADGGFKKFSSAQLGLVGEADVLIPKSVNRLRVSGSGSRFVHGGATLQEVVIPVLTIGKSRESDVAAVDVVILQAGTQKITSSQITVAFYQENAVSEKVKGRRLRAGFYSQSGVLVSESHDLSFESPSENPRDRERKLRFLLAKSADDFEGQNIILKLEELVPGTSQYREYNRAQYFFERSIRPDFDF